MDGECDLDPVSIISQKCMSHFKEGVPWKKQDYLKSIQGKV